MNKKTKDVFVLGLALFAMFFGAGNLIFPPSLGLIAGKNWIVCAIGFFITAIGMPLLGIIASAKAGGTIDDVGNKVGSTFSKIFATIIILAIGPLLAIPRTGATTYEMGIKPIFSGFSPILASIIFFGLTLYFVIKPSEIVDKVGKILTPLLLIMIFVIIIKGIFSPLGTATTIMKESPLSKGFTEGYQTMDALASLVFAGVMLSSLVGKGYTDIKEQVSLTIKAGILAAIGLGLVYGGLIYLGASANSVYALDTPKSDLLMAITNTLLGDFGKVALGIVVALACLTTSIGLTATVGSFFNKLSNNKLSYTFIVIATCIFSAIFANVGVEMIVKVAVPLLVTVYPVAIVLIIMNVFDGFIPSASYTGAVTGALIISLYDGLHIMGVDVGFLENIINKIPLSSFGFAWLIPAVIGGILTALLFSKKNSAYIK
ncbi:branched-chain amino acid transport system II carrier protein [Crassaminicella indica]|uniref:Branched-chain amino acid transport system carrier protein n=1 Tax=Crassaminicella indica TaxID=2855394 RepID=A0ABX8RBW9_9CLOT|nr:branched-chain amino acid transport system II carrier protein [Crassaminicella indica]QXM06548.1 branched-chain amino acid transport system II carrier protein [Crassaminicella indica]